MQPWQDHSLEEVRGQFEGAGSDRQASPRQNWDDASGYDPEAWLDRAIHATRMGTFPLHGLDPLP